MHVDLPTNDAFQRLDQAFQLHFGTNPIEYAQLQQTFANLGSSQSNNNGGGGLPRAWLVQGESGVGKSFTVNNFCAQYKVEKLLTVNVGDLAVLCPGDMAKALKGVLNLAGHKDVSSSVVVFDNIELIFPRQGSDLELVQTFVQWFRQTSYFSRHPKTYNGDILNKSSNSNNSNSIRTNITYNTFHEESQPRILILGLTTLNPQLHQVLDDSIRNIFDELIELEIPTPEERKVILKGCCRIHNIRVVDEEGDKAITASVSAATSAASATQADQRDNEPVLIERVANRCHGYLAADLNALCMQAMENTRRVRPKTTNVVPSSTTATIPQQGIPLHRVSVQELERAQSSIRVSTLRQNTSVQIVDPVPWSSIGGLEPVKRILEESVIWLYKHTASYHRLGIEPSKGILLYGPPGTGKTLLAKAVATESQANFMAVSIPDLIKGEIGESEKAIAQVFKTARRSSPCIVFLDELEAIFGSREIGSGTGGLGKKLISQLLMEIDHGGSESGGGGQGVVILAATNHPESIDSALLRPGRIDRLVYVPPPNFEERVEILKLLGKQTKYDDQVQENLKLVANLTMNFTGADLRALVRKAGLNALKEERAIIEQRDFFAATSQVRPSVNALDLVRFEHFRVK